MAEFVLKLPERNYRKYDLYKQTADINKCEYIMIHTSFNNNKGYSLYVICMSTYFMVIVSIFIHYSKNMSSELKHSLSSLSPSDDELKPSISMTGSFTLFERVDDLFLTGRQCPSTSIQLCSTGDGWLYTNGRWVVTYLRV